MMSQKKVAIGIDLGTTKCCVGVLREGQVEILENERSRKTTPSYVAFTDTERLIGEDAKDQATLNPVNTVFRVKGIMGRDLENSNGTKALTEMPYSIVDEAGDTCINVTYKKTKESFLPQQVTAMLLTKMKELAQNRLGCSVDEAVISVPASFSNAQRQATKDAATIAGLKVLALINEPTAAAIAYQAKRHGKDEETIAVVDFGGGKLDVAIVSVNSASVSVKGLSGTNDFGGNDVDEILMAHVQEKFREKFSLDPPNVVTVLERLRSACVKMKNSLSLLPRVQDQLDCFGDEFLLPISINRKKYEELIYNRIESCLRIHLDRALKISGLNKRAISRVVLVGGSTRIPLVPDEICGYFDGSYLDRSVNTDEAIAQGAAIYAALLSGDNTVTELTVNDVLPNSFCLATEGCSDMQVIFGNLVTIPTIKKFTVNEKTRCLKFELYEELYGRKNPHRLIGTLCLSDEFNKSVRLVSEIAFKIDQCGIFDVMIQLGSSADPSYIFRDVVKNYSVRLNAEIVQNCVARELQLRQDEREEKDRVEAYTNLESGCFRLQEAMETTNGREHFPDLVEQIKTEAGQTIDWLDAEVYVSKSDCRTKLKSLKRLELHLKEDLCGLEKLVKERAAAENALRSFFAKVETFLTNTNVSDEEEKADIVRVQLDLVDKWFKLETVPSKADCDEKRVALNIVFSTFVRALEVRILEKERESSVSDLQAYCRELMTSVNNKPIFEADLQLLIESSDQAKDTLQWLESNDKLASKEECIKRRNSLEEKMKTLQCRAEQREQERVADLEKEREKLESLWSRCHGLCAKVQSSDIGTHNSAFSKNISDQVDAVLARHRNMAKNMSKTECDEALALISNLEGLFLTWVKDHEEKVLQQKLEMERTEASRREMEQVGGSKKQENEQAEADKNEGKEQADAAKKVGKDHAEVDKKQGKEQVDDARKVEKEQVDARKVEKEQVCSDKKRNKEQAEADKKQKNEKAEVAKRQEKEYAKTDKRVAKEQAEADKKQKKEQADSVKRLEKEKCTANKLEKERIDALQSFENKWTSLEATLSMDVLKEIEPVLVNQAIKCAEQTSSWLKVPGSFCPDEYKKRLETLKKLGQDLQSRNQQLRANNADVDCRDSDIVMLDAESESETEHDKSRCNLM